MSEQPKIGEIKPYVQQIGWQVCKKTAEEEDKQEWTVVEKEHEAEILSFVYSYTKAT